MTSWGAAAIRMGKSVWNPFRAAGYRGPERVASHIPPAPTGMWQLLSTGMAEGISINRVTDFPIEPGVYLVYSDARVGWLNWNPAAGVTYVGKADDGLRRRIEKEHNGDTGRSTLRRTLGALLKDDLGLIARSRPSREEPKQINFTNYDFEPEGDQRLTEWIGEHLKVSMIVAKIEGREQSLIAQHEPPLNLTGWRNPFALEIKAARKACADEARRRYVGSI